MYSAYVSANVTSQMCSNSLAAQSDDPLASALSELDSKGIRPGQTQISRSRVMEIASNYDSSKAQSSIYNDGTTLYVVEGHHTIVASTMLGKGTGMNMGVPTQQIPSSKNIYWSKQWYEFWKTSIKIVD